MATRWYRSLYWRIGLGFIVFLAATLIAQGVVGALLVSRAASALPERAPFNFATLVASDLSAALTSDPALDVDGYVRQEYARVSYPIVIVMRDGRVSIPAPFSESDGLVRFARGWLEREASGEPPRRFSRRAGLSPARRPPLEPARIVVDGKVAGLVVVPLRAPAFALVRQLAPALTVVAIVLLATATTMAAFVIFTPAQRRLRALEVATTRLGGGDLTARAEVSGGDEIASLAGSFNAMADELSERARQLEEVDRRRRQLLADVSHELGTPLTAIRGYVETLTMPNVEIDAAARERYLGIISDETTRLERLVADLLDLARLEGGGARIDVEDVSVQQLFDRIVARHERAAAEKSVAFSRLIAPGATTIRGDEGRLEQALQNLAANALRHAPSGSLLSLDAARSNGLVRLSITDAGDGIPPEHLPHVFDRFYKADQSRSSLQSSGSGLGLSIVKAIAERHGGRVEVESQPGRTRFSLIVPAAN